jgi:flagellar basal body-associated protein FliL
MKIAILGFLTVLFIFSGFALVYHHSESITIPIFFGKYAKKDKEAIDGINCEIMANIGEKYVLQMNFKIPCKSKKQRKDLSHNLPGIKSRFLMTFDPEKTDRWVQERNFKAFRTEFLAIVNRFADPPVDNVYFDNFNYF